MTNTPTGMAAPITMAFRVAVSMVPWDRWRSAARVGACMPTKSKKPIAPTWGAQWGCCNCSVYSQLLQDPSAFVQSGDLSLIGRH